MVEIKNSEGVYILRQRASEIEQHITLQNTFQGCRQICNRCKIRRTIICKECDAESRTGEA